jgi:hypothetical protein
VASDDEMLTMARAALREDPDVLRSRVAADGS